MKPDHDAAMKYAKEDQRMGGLLGVYARAYLDAMASLDKAAKERDEATALIERLLEGYNQEYWGPSPDETEKAARAFLAERKSNG